MRRSPLMLLGASLVLAGCTHPVSNAVRNHVLATPPITIAGAGFSLQTAGAVGQSALDAGWAGVLSTLNRYLEAGVLTPLRSGGPAAELAPLFTGPAAARVGSPGPDRAAFIDEGLPPAAEITAQAAVATLTALAGADGVIGVVSADLDLRLVAQVAGAPVTIARRGELVLVPEGGTWRIDAYDLRVTRDSMNTTTTSGVHT